MSQHYLQSRLDTKKSNSAAEILEHTELHFNQFGIAEPSHKLEDEPTWMYWSIGVFIMISFSVLVYLMLHYLEMI